MAKNLVIVESPSKSKTIQKYLGNDFEIMASVGHVRDLPKKDAIDIANDFKPRYEISADKKTVIRNLRKAAREAETVYLATDPDREGEAIAWHLKQVLNVDENCLKRVSFNEITKTAVNNAIAHPTKIDMDVVNAQQARRILDRLVGFELSPLLWRKIRPSLSAGRVQSVAVRLIVERESEIEAFEAKSSFKVTAVFICPEDGSSLDAEISKRFTDAEAAGEFLRSCIGADFTIESIEKKDAKKQPPTPFTTSTLQQEAGRLLSFSVAQTMMLAQQLYEAGLITYMRTDSLNLSETALSMIEKEIVDQFGKEYAAKRHFKTKTKGAQEAHEAIRPTNMSRHDAGEGRNQKRLYKLIWQRSMACQMAPAKVEKTVMKISNGRADHLFEAKGEILTFPGFIKVYPKLADKDKLLPALKEGDKLTAKSITATEKFTQAPARYSEPMLVKKMEELGIGRPSTYAPTISTIQKRGYVVKESRDGVPRNYTVLELKKEKISQSEKTETTGTVKSKLFPTDMGRVVNSFLIKFFGDIINYGFTAEIEDEFDQIASGSKIWQDMLKEFYFPFHEKVEATQGTQDSFRGQRLLGKDPKSNENIYAKVGRYGPMVQLGESQTDSKPRFASLLKGQSIYNITLQDALDLLAFPKMLGRFEDEEITVAFGRFGPYVKHKGSFYSIPASLDPVTVDLETAIDLIVTGREKKQKSEIKHFEAEGIRILDGRYGPYMKYKGMNYKIPKTVKDPASLSAEACLELIKKSKTKKKKK